MARPIDVNKFDQNAIYDLPPPMPDWRWKAKFDGPEMSGVNFNDLIIEKVSAPNGEVIQVDSSFGGGRTTYFPSFPETGQITISMYETDTGAANLSLASWGDAVKSQDGWYGLPINYKGTLIVNLFGYSSNVQPVYSYSFEGIWPSDTGTFDLGYDNDGRLIISVTFSVDRILTGARTA